MVRRHHQCNEDELGKTLGDGDGQGGLVCCSPWGRKESDSTGRLNNNSSFIVYLTLYIYYILYNIINILWYGIYWGLSWWLSGKESTCQCRRCRFDPWVKKTPWRSKWQPTPVFLPGKSHGQRSLVGNRDCKRVTHNLATKQQQ